MKHLFQKGLIALLVCLIVLWCSACGTIGQEDVSELTFSDATNSEAGSQNGISNSSHATTVGLPNYTQTPEIYLYTDGRGWAFYPGQSAGRPELFETKDGGRSWTEAEILLPRGMDGVSYFVTSLLEKQGEVVLVLQVKHKPPLATDIFYEFILDEATSTWQWNTPAGISRLGENSLEFYNYIVSQAQYFPSDFSAESGLYDRITIQKLIYDTAAWKAEREHLQPPVFVTYEEVNRMATALYTITNFDATFMEEGGTTWFQVADGGWLVSFEEYIGDGWETLLEDVQMNTDGTILATTLTVFGPPDRETSVQPILRKSTVQPGVYEGKPVFTLLKNQQYEFTEADWPMPHWLWGDKEK